MKWCFFVALVAFAAIVAAEQEYDDEYDNYYDYDTLKELDAKLSDDLGEFDDPSEDKDVKPEDELQKVDEDNKEILASREILDSIDDYQVEDNRESKEGVEKEEDNNDPAEVIDSKEDPIAEAENKDDYALLWGDDSVAPEPAENESPEDVQINDDDEDKIIEETKNILEETDDNFDENPKEPNKEIVEEAKNILESDGDEFEPEIKNDETMNQEDIDQILEETKNILEEADNDFDDDPKDNEPNMEIVEETKKILEETDDDFDDIPKDNEPNMEIVEETKQILEDDDDEFEPKVNEDVKTDKLDDTPKIEDVLLDTKDKLEELDPVEDNLDLSNDEISIKVSDDEGNPDQNEDEDTVDIVEADLKEDLSKLLDTLNKLTENGSDGDKSENDKKSNNFLEEDANEFDNDNIKESKEVLDYDRIDKILDDIIAQDGDIKSGELDALLNDELNEPNPDDTFVEDAETVPKEEIKSHPIAYINDAFIDEEKDENIEENKSTENQDASIENTVNVEDLSDRQLEELTKQFVEAHADEIDLKSPKLAEDTAPIHQTLYLDEIINITSFGYPENYPVNNIEEWVLEGDGMGIEMNITDLLINSAMGHYLLIKPGGIDATGEEGLLFAYRLNSPRRYRFFDVDRMYIKFYTMTGMSFLRGFEISLKMISPRPERDLIPEPEPVTLEPNITARVTLGLPIHDFRAVKEDFRLIIAEMITSYLAQEDLETAMDLDETTKIIHVTSCPLNWPDRDRCTAVTFGANLDVDIDLMKMWVQYNGVEPWVSSLAKLGIKDMLPPDMSMMTVWLVIGSGVVISMAMLAFVLWRYSCFDDYTRMKNYSETDSIISEKRGLDLYPTPHQTLPPLYHDEYQIGHEATVDMSGFENKSYVRETMYDFESDEEVVTPRDRFTTDV